MGEARKPGEGRVGPNRKAWTPSFDGGKKEHKKGGFRGAWGQSQNKGGKINHGVKKGGVRNGGGRD